ncbi:MAG: hypothetical protein ABI557_11695 [Aureliella sp.]
MPKAEDQCMFCYKNRCDHDAVPNEPGELFCPLSKWQRKENAAKGFARWTQSLRFKACADQYMHFEPSY